MTTSVAGSRSRAAVWSIVGIAWILAWVFFIVGHERTRLYAAIVLLVCMAIIGALQWRHRDSSGNALTRSKEN